jgi:hypothetical protein
MRTAPWVLPLLGAAALGSAIILYQVDPAAYLRVLGILMLQPSRPPFLDAVQIPALVECWRQGVDVYVTAPCDPLDRTLAYSPLWLRATFLPSDPAWTIWLGLALTSAFVGSLAFLPRPRSGQGVVVMALALCSSMPVFALERGNMDVVMFVLVAFGGRLWLGRFPLRSAGYLVVAFAGLLKFYPLVLFLLFLRERIGSFIALCLAGAALLAGFVWYFQDELVEMARNFPSLGIFTDTFGYRVLPSGLGTMLQRLFDAAGARTEFTQTLPTNPLFAVGVLGFLLITALVLAIRLATRPAFRSSLQRIGADEAGFLVIGAALVCGCFFVGQSVSYKGIHFLFVVPGLFALATAPFPGATRRLFRTTAAMVLALMWGLTLQQLVARLSGGTARPMGGSAAMNIYWIGHELAWWWVVSVLLAILFCFVAQSPVWPALAGLSRRLVPAARLGSGREEESDRPVP